MTYIHWKGNDHLDEGLNGDTDLDVLLAEKDRVAGCAILNDIGFVQFHSQFGSRYPNVEDWIGFDEATGRLLHLHLHYALVSGHPGLKEFELPWTKEALDTRIQDPASEVYIMDPNLELVSLYTRLITKAKRSWVIAALRGRFKINKHFSKEIEYVKKRVEWDKVNVISSKFYGTKQSAFIEIVRSEEMTSKQFLQLYAIVSKAMSGYRRLGYFSLAIKRLFYSVAFLLRGLLRKKMGIMLITRKVANPDRGFSIAIIGQDGSGKSTVTTDIEKWLNWKIDACRFYLGSGEHYNSIFKSIINAARGIRRREAEGSKVDNKRNTESSASIRKKNLKNWISSILVSMNCLSVSKRAYRIIKRSNGYCRKGGIALFDRFPQVQFEGIYDGPKIDDYRRKTGLDYWIVRHLAKRERGYLERIQQYQPKLVFKLLLSPEISLQRKPFENFEAIKKKALITSELSFPNSRVVTIDASQDYQSELLYIKRIIWEELVAQSL